MQGRRRQDGQTHTWEPGDYGKWGVDGEWYACSPLGQLGSLAGHEVIEHEDGTITVSPSLLITDDRGEYHGFLQNGVWVDA